MSRHSRSNEAERRLPISLQIAQKPRKMIEGRQCKRVFANCQPALYNDLADSESA